jgi:hypothetical protein
MWENSLFLTISLLLTVGACGISKSVLLAGSRGLLQGSLKSK